MKKYANIIAGSVSGSAAAILSYYAWPIMTQDQYSNIAWMASSMILLIFIGFFKLLSDILKEIL